LPSAFPKNEIIFGQESALAHEFLAGLPPRFKFPAAVFVLGLCDGGAIPWPAPA